MINNNAQNRGELRAAKITTLGLNKQGFKRELYNLSIFKKI